MLIASSVNLFARSVKASSEPSVNAPLSTLPTAARNVLFPLALNAESCSKDTFSKRVSAMPAAIPVLTALSIVPPLLITSFAAPTPALVPIMPSDKACPPGTALSGNKEVKSAILIPVL